MTGHTSPYLFIQPHQAGLGRLLDGETKPPTRKEEAWRFTDLGKLYGKRHVQPPQVLQKEQLAAVAAKVEEHTLEVCAGRVMVRRYFGGLWKDV